MNKPFSIIVMTLLIIQSNILQSQSVAINPSESYEWAIVGAGLAGITAMAVLLEAGVDPATVAWIDPEFKVGRVGKYYRNVPGNIQISRMILYINLCPFFKNIVSASLAKIFSYDPEDFKLLHVIADPLLDFTNYLCNQVVPKEDFITSLTRIDDQWVLEGTRCTINAQKVILAIGAEPRRLDYDVPEIPLDEALDKEKLASYLSCDDCVAVFGGMHSAILMLKYLCDYSVKKIINFYRDPYFYGAPGLEGDTALWAQTILEQTCPDHLSRVLNTPENREELLPTCTKVIYAIGYQQSPILVNGTLDITFDEYTGVIDENLYGIGIAFPPTGIINGHRIAKNGLHAYLAYAKKLMPQWIANDKSHVQAIEDSELPWI
jgi:thioredoxin reductase